MQLHYCRITYWQAWFYVGQGELAPKRRPCPQMFQHIGAKRSVAFCGLKLRENAFPAPPKELTTLPAHYVGCQLGAFCASVWGRALPPNIFLCRTAPAHWLCCIYKRNLHDEPVAPTRGQYFPFLLVNFDPSSGFPKFTFIFNQSTASVAEKPHVTLNFGL